MPRATESWANLEVEAVVHPLTHTPTHEIQRILALRPELAPLTGREVVIHGLSVDKFNGLHVTAGTYNSVTKRYSVELPDGDVKGLKPENLRRANTAEGDETGKTDVSLAQESLKLGNRESGSGKSLNRHRHTNAHTHDTRAHTQGVGGRRGRGEPANINAHAYAHARTHEQ